jgi:hypothetical protein
MKVDQNKKFILKNKKRFIQTITVIFNRKTIIIHIHMDYKKIKAKAISRSFYKWHLLLKQKYQINLITFQKNLKKIMI